MIWPIWRWKTPQISGKVTNIGRYFEKGNKNNKVMEEQQPPNVQTFELPSATTHAVHITPI